MEKVDLDADNHVENQVNEQTECLLIYMVRFFTGERGGSLTLALDRRNGAREREQKEAREQGKGQPQGLTDDRRFRPRTQSRTAKRP